MKKIIVIIFCLIQFKSFSQSASWVVWNDSLFLKMSGDSVNVTQYSSITTARWGSLFGNIADQPDLQSALSAKQNAGNYLITTNNLSDLSNTSTARLNIGLGNVTNESKATMFSSPVFTGTISMPGGSITSAMIANGANISGNAGTATSLQTGRTINGVLFDGTQNITLSAAAGTLTGTALANNITATSITSTGDLINGSIGTGYVIKQVTMTLGSDTNYDIYYRNNSGILTRLAPGIDGYVLTTHGTDAAPNWTQVNGSGQTYQQTLATMALRLF